MLSAAEVQRVVRRAWDRYVTVLDSLAPCDWDRPTELAGWAVRDLVAHTVWGVSMQADALRRWRTKADGPGAGRTVDPSSEPATLLDAQVAACAELAHALDHLAGPDVVHGDQRPVPMPYGELPVDLVLQILAMEAAVHDRDLQAVVGDPDPLGPHAVSATAVVLAAFLPVLASTSGKAPAAGTAVVLRSPTLELGLRHDGSSWSVGPAAASAEVISGDDSSLVLFALGRAPARAVSGSARARADFKAWFPGP